MSSLPPVIGAKQVAHLLGMNSASYFYTRRPHLEKHGFPRKLPGLNGWSSRAILRWIENQDEQVAIAPPHDIVVNRLEQAYAPMGSA